uniref:Pleiotropic regulator 1 n=1 Tax=Strongyloides stercoralis TaxID=6248 RepID=A0A0K0DXD0_STRER
MAEVLHPVGTTEDNNIDKNTNPPQDVLEKRKQLLDTICHSMKRTHELFYHDYDSSLYDDESVELWKKYKLNSECKSVKRVIENNRKALIDEKMNLPKHQYIGQAVDNFKNQLSIKSTENNQLAITSNSKNEFSNEVSNISNNKEYTDHSVRMLLPSKAPLTVKPKWHPPWKLYRVIAGHTGWVRCVDVEPGNQYFVTGGSDRIIKVWDLATGNLKLSLTGHISSVRGVKISPRHPFLFSCGEDKQVKCWDLEVNKVVRHYHGHLSAVQGLSIHPTLDVLCTAGRDCTVRVWDIRTKAQIHTLTGHTNTVACVVTQATNPQIISGSHDSTVRLWDLAAGKTWCTLTHHKKSIRALTLHPNLYMFASGSTNNIRQWKSKNAEMVRSLNQHQAVINALGCNEDGVLVSGGDNGSLHFWDWNSGFCFQQDQVKAQPGSIDSESGIFCLTFDKSGSRLITGDADKSIKMYKEDLTATEESHPLQWRPNILKRQKF